MRVTRTRRGFRLKKLGVRRTGRNKIDYWLVLDWPRALFRQLRVGFDETGNARMSAKAKASDPTYELESLGWKAFQDLCATIVADLLGHTIQIFLPSRDGGRDGAFHGQWKTEDGATTEGSFTVQCKFSSKEALLGVADLHDELAKAARLASRGLATNYVLMTNLKVSGVTEESVREKFLAIQGIDRFLLFGREWITLKIRESATLRMLVPRVYGLGDLSQILDERAYAQASDVLSALGDDLAKFVVTSAHRRAARALLEHGFVLLLGEPAAGKSTIAASLAIGALDQWGAFTAKIRSADEFVQHWNPHEPRQFFWIDDAFGTTQYQRELASAWNRAWPHVAAAIRKGARVLFTSRDYIYRAARTDLKTSAFPLINESQVVINVQRLSTSEKKQILYNHIRLGEQPRYFRSRIKPFLEEVADSSHFLPEIARRLGSPLFTKSLEFRTESVRAFVERPLSFLAEVVTTLDPASRAALALVFMRAGALQSPVELSENEQAALQILGVALPAAREALVALDGSLVSLVRSSGHATWMFKHPTIGDAYASIVAADPELLDVYLSWTTPEKLLGEVTCGDVGLQGVKVVVPINRFERFAERLKEIRPGRPLYSFLATRCARDFLKLYLELHPELGDMISEPGSYLSAVAEVDLLVRLHRLQLLPEPWRKRFVSRAMRLGVETPDVDFLSSKRIRALFNEDEIGEAIEVLRNELLPSLSSIVENWYFNCEADSDPEEWFHPLREVIGVLSIELGEQPSVARLLDGVCVEIDEAVERIHDNRPLEPDGDDGYRPAEGTGSSTISDRSVFDDIDQ